jgi:hypothetical protein
VDEFVDKDREAMARRILATDKTVLAFKILAANRKTSTRDQTREAFRWAFAHIKPKDAIVVGMFPKYGDQVAEKRRLHARVRRAGGCALIVRARGAGCFAAHSRHSSLCNS